MTGIFKSNNPYNTFLLFFYGLFLKAPIFLHPTIPRIQNMDGFFYNFFLKWLSPAGKSVPIIYSIMAYLLLYIQAITFNKSVNEHRLMQRPNYLTGMTYMLITSLFAEWNILSAGLIINTFLVWVWARLSSLYNNPNPKKTLFNVGFVISICSFFYFPSCVFVVLIIFGLANTRSFKMAEWIIAFIGIIAPYYFLLSYLFLTDEWKEYHLPKFSISSPAFGQTKLESTAFIILLIAFLAGLYCVKQNFRRQLIQSRKSWNLTFLYFIIALFIPFLNRVEAFTYFILCIIPLSAFIGCTFLYPQNKWIPNVLHWLIVFLVISLSYFM